MWQVSARATEGYGIIDPLQAAEGRGKVRSAIRDDGSALAGHGCSICGGPFGIVTGLRETAQRSG